MSLFPESRAWRIILLVAAAGLVWLLVLFFDSDRSLEMRQDTLIEWSRAGSPSDFADDFAASGYHDQWGHTPADVVLIIRAARLSHPNMGVITGPRTTKRDGDTAVITQKITVTGTGERIDTDFHFTWHKEGIWPWSWKLQEVTAPGLR